MMRWERYDVSVTAMPWERPGWEREQQFDNAGAAFRAFHAAIDHALATGEACRVYLVARAGRTAQTFGTFEWGGASGS